MSDQTPEASGGEPEGAVLTIGGPWPWEDFFIAERGFTWHPEAGNLLLLVEDNVTERMCEDLTGTAELALIAHGPLVGLMVKFGGGWDWMETMLWRLPGQAIPETLVDEPEGAEGHLMFRVVLVDRPTRTIRHMRAFTVSPHMTKAMQREVAYRWREGTTMEEGAAARDEWAAKHPTPKSAVRASLARSRSGD